MMTSMETVYQLILEGLLIQAGLKVASTQMEQVVFQPIQ